MQYMTLLIAADHGGYALKQAIIAASTTLTCVDLGTHSSDRVDYPFYADTLCQQLIESPSNTKGILICGTGIGVSIRANRYKGIRAALVHDRVTATMASAHNNANVLCLGGRTTSVETALLLIHDWLNTPFEGDRHINRLHQLDADVRYLV
jgi:ribose 5-phosphate isomerase B